MFALYTPRALSKLADVDNKRSKEYCPLERFQVTGLYYMAVDF